MKNLIALLTFALSIIHCTGQDIHFSQIMMEPLNLNPALTGSFNGDQRASLNYKDQWTSFTSGFKTYSFTFDSKIIIGNATLGAGINIFKDVAGEVQLGTTKGMASISSIIDINQNQQITAGIQGGFAQKSLNPNALIWDDQYVNGGYDPTSISQELFSFESFYYGDFSAGLSWNYKSAESNISSYDATFYELGVAMHHINRPRLKFTNENERLYSKYMIHGKGQIGVRYTDLSFQPSFLIAIQGPSKEIVAGTLLRLRMQEASHFTGYFAESAVAIGCHFRVGEAIIPSAVLEIGSFALGVSYDINVNGLRPASQLRGGMEVSLRFINPSPFKYKGKGRNASF